MEYRPAAISDSSLRIIDPDAEPSASLLCSVLLGFAKCRSTSSRSLEVVVMSAATGGRRLGGTIHGMNGCHKQATGQLTELTGMPGRVSSPQPARYVLICSPLSGLSGVWGSASALRLPSNPSGCQ